MQAVTSGSVLSEPLFINGLLSQALAGPAFAYLIFGGWDCCMKHDRIPGPQDIYRHYKGKLYQIITLAQHSESNELLVVYQALYGDFRVYARSLESFIEELNPSIYPEAGQKHRFELVKAGDAICTDKNISLPDNKALEDMETADAKKAEAGTAKEANMANERHNAEQSLPDTEAYAVLLKFLEADSYSKKLDVVYSGKKYLNDRIITDMAMALDCSIDDGSLDKRTESLINCLQALSRFENKRLR